ncbi:dolichyl-phosphate beta-D-mannosyltransferase [Actinomyces respiraculi]|uniref:Dolichyl-phosphate beta-D-mannosyltransferase n=1 Tax=Actinomyces respiraculi TaxID=2744574 RepID=A0A7T0PYD1_9ACTO|nr:dolichyl-phosphate beta-D-mannosyltransferase [Actinomyces respiraculi]
MDALSWAWWLFAATLARTLLSTDHVIYPRLIAAAVAYALLVQLTARLVTRRYWPWSSTRVMRHASAAGLGYALSLVLLDTVGHIRLLPWSAVLAGSLLAIGDQWWRRRRWQRKAVALARLEVYGV